MIIGFVQTKGGTGKSTLALNTAFSKTAARAFEMMRDFAREVFGKN